MYSESLVAHKNVVKEFRIVIEYVTTIDNAPSPCRPAKSFIGRKNCLAWLPIAQDNGQAKKTALHWATERDHQGCSELLLRAGASSTTIPDAGGVTVEQLLQQRNKPFDLATATYNLQIDLIFAQLNVIVTFINTHQFREKSQHFQIQLDAQVDKIVQLKSELSAEKQDDLTHLMEENFHLLNCALTNELHLQKQIKTLIADGFNAKCHEFSHKIATVNPDQIGQLKKEIVAQLNDTFFEGNNISPHVAANVSENNQSFFYGKNETPVTQNQARCLVM